MPRTDILVINAHERGGGAEFVYADMVGRLSASHAVGTLSGGSSLRPGHVRVPSRRGSQAMWVALSPLVGAWVFLRVLAALLFGRPRVAVVHNLWPTVGLGGLAALALGRRLLGVRCVLVAHDFQYVCATSMLYDFAAGRPCRTCVGRRVKTAPLTRGCDKGGRLASAAKAVRLLAARGPLAPARLFHATVAPSRTVADAMVADGFARDSVSVIPNGLSLDIPPAARRGPVVLFAGRLEPEKGADLLPDVAEALSRIAPGVRVRVLGDGSLSGKLRKEVAERGLGHAIEFMGSVPRGEVLGHAAASRVFLFPSRWVENCPLSLAEAVACGLVPVVSDACEGGLELLARVGVEPVRAPALAEPMALACAAALAVEPRPGVREAVTEVHDPIRAGALTDRIVLGA